MENSKTSKQIWTDLIKDLIGFDRGYYYTLRAVYSNPTEVLESYFNNRGKYLSPFTLVSVSFGVYYLISGFLVDWDAVSASLKHLFKGIIEWEIDLISNQPNETKSFLAAKVFNDAIVPMTYWVVLGISKYLIAIIFPIQIVCFYATSVFTKKFGFGFYHHFVAFNYYFSFSLLFLNATIIISLINIWLAVPAIIAFNYFFYGHFFKSYGESKESIKKAFRKGFIVGTIVLMFLSGLVGLMWGAILGR